MNRSLLLLLLVSSQLDFLFGKTNTSAICGGAYGWSVFGTNCYKLFIADDVNYQQAEQICKTMNANVVSIHSEAENKFVAQLTAIDFDTCLSFCKPKAGDKWKARTFEGQPIFQSWWIGLHRVASGNANKLFISTWSDGSPVDYGDDPTGGHGDAANYPWSIWQPASAAYTGPAENCVHFWWKTGWWNDVQCEHLLAGVVCKKPVQCA